jgi:hypothetical protein
MSAKGATMTNVRRVAVVDGSYVGEVINDDPNGDHMLVPVETWEEVVGALASIAGDVSDHEFELRGRYGYPRLIKHARRALAEIGEE